MTDPRPFDILQSGPGWWDRMPFDRLKRRDFITLIGGVAAAARVHPTLAYIVARRDRVLIFASPMSEPYINSVIERESGGLAEFSRLPQAA